MKTKKAIKYILKHPELFTEGELMYVEKIKRERKQHKIQSKSNEPSKTDISNT